MSKNLDEDITDVLEESLEHIAVLGDLIQSYSPGHGGQTMFGDTITLAGNMVFAKACDAKKAMDNWREAEKTAKD